MAMTIRQRLELWRLNRRVNIARDYWQHVTDEAEHWARERERAESEHEAEAEALARWVRRNAVHVEIGLRGAP